MWSYESFVNSNQSNNLLEVFGIKVHSCNLNNPQEKVDLNFDNVFQLVDLWLANETKFEKTKDKIQEAVKDRNLYLTCSDLLRNVFFMD